ncbi:hypothetical protein PUR59_12465 [Streptomyces sp. SP18ES09]|uniref:hypothetical protein n=1 Tax=Streptomyces sp. SP18ES09 TaxID=3002532 RepID=UPI002E7983F1|nr:hypothetical protein [Streptomyces sp. SP18ES09]MEE1815819.1 hypothetical protein [Streptomyces sp. SP18ES09]
MREHDIRGRSGDGSDAVPPPVYPGESTGIGSERDDDRVGLGDRDDRGERDRSDEVRDPGTVPGPDTDADSGTGPGYGVGTDSTAATDTGTERDGGAGRGERTTGERPAFGDRPGTTTGDRPAADDRPATGDPVGVPSEESRGREHEPDTPGGAGEGADRAGAAHEENAPARLLDPMDEEAFRNRWHDIQSRFVDDPREAVHDADGLVTDVIRQLAATFGDRKKDLEGQWSEGEDVDTESLRKALRQYRSFFHRLLSA